MRAQLEPRAGGDGRAKPEHILGHRESPGGASQRGRRDGLGVQEVGFFKKMNK